MTVNDAQQQAAWSLGLADGHTGRRRRLTDVMDAVGRTDVGPGGIYADRLLASYLDGRDVGLDTR